MIWVGEGLCTEKDNQKQSSVKSDQGIVKREKGKVDWDHEG